MMEIRIVISLLFVLTSADCLRLSSYPRMTSCTTHVSVGEPLFLTPYIEAGRAADGRKAARVPPLLDNIRSYSGYLTVNKNYDSNMFFWYFPAENNPESAPVALWLQGGPGESSTVGLFIETGPISINDNLTVSGRRHHWTKDIHMIYIDNPVGTGFSFTKGGYVTDQEAVGRDLYYALVQFYQLFPELQTREFFITGESYAGKYIPALAYTIHINNPTAIVKINLEGIAIGDGFIDPENMLKYGDYMSQLGLIDDDALQQFRRTEAQVADAIRAGQFQQAAKSFGKIFKLFIQVAGPVDLYEYLLDGNGNSGVEALGKFLCQANVRKRIHVGNLPFNDGTTVEKYLRLDAMKSVKPWLQVLMDHYRVLLYNGQLDIVVGYPLTINFVKKLQWSGASEYLTAKRKKWFVGERLAGYSKSARNFTELLVRNAGHMVPCDQPKWAQEMIRKFVFNVPF